MLLCFSILYPQTCLVLGLFVVCLLCSQTASPHGGQKPLLLIGSPYQIAVSATEILVDVSWKESDDYRCYFLIITRQKCPCNDIEKKTRHHRMYCTAQCQRGGTVNHRRAGVIHCRLVPFCTVPKPSCFCPFWHYRGWKFGLCSHLK